MLNRLLQYKSNKRGGWALFFPLENLKVAQQVEAIALRLEAIATRVEAIAITQDFRLGAKPLPSGCDSGFKSELESSSCKKDSTAMS